MVRPKKHLGQHFLIDENAAARIVSSIDLPSSSEVLEVGPGTGVLTKYLLEETYRFRAFDVDEDSVSFLRETFPEHAEKFFLQDFLQTGLEGDRIVIIGNFPYNISSQLFFKIWEHRNQIDQVVCMVQKEVAQRIAATHGSKTYGILSVLLQAFYTVDYLFSVPPGAFNPPPKVQSGVIRLTRNDIRHLGCDENMLKKVVKMAFGKRRKTLRNALKELDLPTEFVKDDLFDKRAEQLAVEQFIDLTSRIEKWKAQPPLN